MDETELAALQQIIDVPIKELVRLSFYRNFIAMGRTLQWIQMRWEQVERDEFVYQRWEEPVKLALEFMQLRWIPE